MEEARRGREEEGRGERKEETKKVQVSYESEGMPGISIST